MKLCFHCHLKSATFPLENPIWCDPICALKKAEILLKDFEKKIGWCERHNQYTFGGEYGCGYCAEEYNLG